PKQAAGRAVKDAQIVADHASAALTTAKANAKGAARSNKGRVPPAEHDALLRAIERDDTAQVALEQARTASRAARTAHTRAFMPKGMPEPAYVSHQDLPPRAAALPTGKPKVRISARRTGEAIQKGILDVH